jgi:hypothetical protein
LSPSWSIGPEYVKTAFAENDRPAQVPSCATIGDQSDML